MKKFSMFWLCALFWVNSFAQDYGRVVITNGGKGSPNFIASLNGIRLNNDYVSSVTFRYVEDTHCHLRILQAGSASPLTFTLSNEARYVSSYILLKDQAGRYSLVLQSKSLMVDDVEPERAVGTPAAVNATPAGSVAASAPGAITATIMQGPIETAPVEMDAKTFNRKLDEVKAKNFDDERMERIREAYENEYFNTNQVITLMKLFSFDDKRLEVAKFAYKRTVDQNEFYRCYDTFTFASYKTQLKDWVAKNKGK